MLNYWVQRPTHWDDIISNLEHTFKSLTLTAQMTNRLVWFTHSDMHCIFHTVNQTELVWMLNLRPEQKMCSMCFHRVKHMLNGEDVLRIWKKCLWAVWNALRCLALVLPWSTAAGTLTCCMVTVSRLWCFNDVCWGKLHFHIVHTVLGVSNILNFAFNFNLANDKIFIDLH